jgi:hypothetical protein
VAAVDREPAVAERLTGRVGVGERRAGGVEAAGVEHRDRPLEAGLGGLEGLCRAHLVGGGALLEDEVAARVGGGERGDDEQHQHDDECGGAAVATGRAAWAA